MVQNTIPKSIPPEEVKKATEEDSLLQKVKAAVANGRWNDPQLSNFSPFKEELSVINGLIFRGHRLVIPSKLRKRTIDIAHHSHQDIVKTKQLIREKVWFPGIDKLVEETVQSWIPNQTSNPKHTHIVNPYAPCHSQIPHRLKSQWTLQVPAHLGSIC